MGKRRSGKKSEGRLSSPVASTVGVGARERPTRRALGLLILLAALPFLNSLPNDFVFDDKLIIVADPRIKSLEHLPALFTTGYWAPNPKEVRAYRPLVTVSYAVNYALGGLDPFGYHLVNAAAHVGVSLLLYLLTLRLFQHQEAALLAAAIFAVHPLHTEAVTGIVGRAELCAAFFFLLSWWLYLEGRDRPQLAILSVGAFGLALLSKEHAMTLPGVLMLSDQYVARDSAGQSLPLGQPARQDRTWLRRYSGYLGILVGYIFLWAIASGKGQPVLPSVLDNPLAHVGLRARLFTALDVAGRYLWLMVWPQYLSPDYSFNQIPVATSLGEPRVLLAGLVWGVLIGMACWSYRGGRRVFLCVGFTLITFSITSNFLVPIGTIMGERLFYLPSAGLCLLAGVAWRRWLEWRRGTPGFVRARKRGLCLVAVILLLLAARTVVRNQDWRNEETLFQSAARTAPNSAKIRSNLGGILLEKGRTEAALRELQASIAILPTSMAHRNLGTLYLRSGESQRAIPEYRRAIDLDPRNAAAYADLGYVLLSQGASGEAIAALEKAIALNPGLAEAHYTLGRARATRGRWSEAVAAYQEALRRKPDFMEASYALGLALEARGEYLAAARAFEEALRLRPGVKGAHRRLGELYRDKLGDPERAQRHLRKAEESEESSGRGSASNAGHGGSAGQPVPPHGQ